MEEINGIEVEHIAVWRRRAVGDTQFKVSHSTRGTVPS